MIDDRYIYRQHKITYNEKLFGMCPWGANDPLEMLCVNGKLIEFNPFINGFWIEDAIPYKTTYKIINESLFIISLTILTRYDEENDEEIYTEYLPCVFKNISENGVFADFVSGIITFDNYNEDEIDDGNYDKFHCHVKNGIIIKVVQAKDNPFKLIEDNLIDFYVNNDIFFEQKINFLSPTNKEYFPFTASKDNNIMNYLKYNMNNNTYNNRKSYVRNSDKRNTFNELTDGNLGDFRDYGANISDLLDNMGRG